MDDPTYKQDLKMISFSTKNNEIISHNLVGKVLALRYF